MSMCRQFPVTAILISMLLSMDSITLNSYASNRSSGEESPSIDSTFKRPVIQAIRTSSSISIDGQLNEAEWRSASVSQFTQRDPNEGNPATLQTEVWVAYDDAALYVAALLHDTSPDSIISRMGRRDADISSDWFYVGIDPYHDRRTGFYFGVYASGSITDGILFNDEWDDNSWDGVWDAATNIDDKGWTVEMRIPYSQLRFPKQDEYVWGINFIRQIERRQERDDFVLVPKKESGWVSRFADLTGIRDINPPRKFELLPYIATSGKFLQHDAKDPFNDGSVQDYHIGTDIKLGLGSNFTLNATINPDFGQVEIDPAVVNLTQFETIFEEKRPFFIEGSSFFNFGYGGANNNWGFNFGNPDYFYSRRVGRSPKLGTQHAGFTDIPEQTTILGAAKLTGKISDGWSLGTLQALTAEEHGITEDGTHQRYDDIVEPLTYFGVLRSQKEFNDGRQAIGLISTAAVRNFTQDYLVDSYNHQSFSFGIDGWTNLDSDQNYVLTGWGSGTHIRGSQTRIANVQQNPLHYFQRPDARYLGVDATATSLSGYAGRVAINKQKGNFYLNFATGLISPGFDSNDMGTMFRTDVINSHIVVGYRWYEPDGFFRRKNFNIATFRSYSFGGERIGEGYFLFYNAQFMNYWGINGNLTFNPSVYDNRYTRGGPLLKTTNGYFGSFFLYSDSRNPITFEIEMGSGRTESGGYGGFIGPGLIFKPTSGLKVSFRPSINRDVTIAQWVNNFSDATASATYGTRHVFGKIDQRELSANIRVDWTFTPKLSLQLFLQPLVSVGTYSEFKELKQPGTYTFNRYGIDNTSEILQADHDYMLDPDGGGPLDSIQVYTGDYVVNPDGPGPAPIFTFSNPDFNFKSLLGNAVLRWEYLPGSTLYFVWTRSQTNEFHPGSYDFGRDFHNLIYAEPNNVFLIKVAYWWNP